MFTIERETTLDDLQCRLVEARHNTSGARVIHIQNDDPENLFSLCFQTYPADSTGVAHILEHTVLCGSKKYPVKDPFFGMMKRSLNTFMNAMTGADFTCYPAASCVEKDFYNLLDVYMDAVFHPRLNELSFMQEGHRLEYEEKELQFKGVVFNEMKGVLSSPEARLWETIVEALMPDTPYKHNFGGDPKVIPDLTYEAFVAFHRQFYHPSQCLFFFYGNLPLEKHLEKIEALLDGVEKQPSISPPNRQPRFHQEKKITGRYPLNEENQEDRALVAFAWLTADATNLDEALAMALLDGVLMESDASPLKLALLQSGLLAKADAFLDTDIIELPYLLTLRGCKAKEADAIEALLFKTLRGIKRFDDELVEGAIHQLEFSQKEISTHYGLSLSFRALAAKFLGIDVAQGLSLSERFSRLRENVKDPTFLLSLMDKYLIQNPHRVRLVMEGDSELEKREAEEEKERLRHLVVDEDQVRQGMEALESFQEEEDDVTCLPTVTLADVPPDVLDYPLEQFKAGELEVYHHDCFTNGIVYAELVYDLPPLTEAELPLARLATSLWTDLGAANRSYEENLKLIALKTGALSASLGMFTQVDDPLKARPALMLRGKALDHNVSALFSLFKDLLEKPRFDETARIKQLIEQTSADLKSRLSTNPLSYAINLALAPSRPQHAVNLHWYGLRYYQFIEQLKKGSLPSFDVMERLLHLSKPTLILSCSQGEFDKLKKEAFFGLGALKSRPCPPWQFQIKSPRIEDQARIISSAVSFSAESFETVTESHPDAPALTVAMSLLETEVLHKRIREQGGAYGSGARYSATLGNVHCYSYRDPHLMSTFKAFEESFEKIAAGKFDAADLEGAKLKHIQDEEAPVAPSTRAFTAYAHVRTNNTKAHRQAFRDHIIALTKEEIKRVVGDHLVGKKGIKVTFSGKELLDREKLPFKRFSLDEVPT